MIVHYRIAISKARINGNTSSISDNQSREQLIKSYFLISSILHSRNFFFRSLRHVYFYYCTWIASSIGNSVSARRLSTTFFQKCDAGAHNKDKFIRIKIVRSEDYSYNEVPERERESACRGSSRSRVTRYFRNSHYDNLLAQWSRTLWTDIKKVLSHTVSVNRSHTQSARIQRSADY